MRKEWMAHFIYWLRKEIKKNTWPHLDIKSFFECTTQNEIYENKMKFIMKSIFNHEIYLRVYNSIFQGYGQGAGEISTIKFDLPR